jgi:hypothetical protein
MKKYYYVDAKGDVQGPVGIDALENLHKSSEISKSTQILLEGTEEWLIYNKIQVNAELSDPYQSIYDKYGVTSQPKQKQSKIPFSKTVLIFQISAILCAIVGILGVLSKNPILSIAGFSGLISCAAFAKVIDCLHDILHYIKYLAAKN